MKKIILICLILASTIQGVSAATYKPDFSKIADGQYKTEKLNDIKENGFSWNNEGGNLIVKTENGNTFINNSTRPISLVLPEKSRKITIKAKMRTDDFESVKFPLCFRGGKLTERDYIYGHPLTNINGWGGGLGIIPQYTTTEYNPDTMLLSVGWGITLNENDNDVYIYKNEWFDAGISYDYADKTFRAYYSYDGKKFYEVYSKVIEPEIGGEEAAIRAIYLSQDMDYSNISVECNTDYIYDVKIKNSNNEYVKKLTNETSFDIIGKAYDPYNEMNSIKTMAAVYDKETGKLLQVKSGSNTSIADKDNLSLGHFEIDTYNKPVSIKFFAWDSLADMKSYCQATLLN